MFLIVLDFCLDAKMLPNPKKRVSELLLLYKSLFNLTQDTMVIMFPPTHQVSAPPPDPPHPSDSKQRSQHQSGGLQLDGRPPGLHLGAGHLAGRGAGKWCWMGWAVVIKKRSVGPGCIYVIETNLTRRFW